MIKPLSILFLMRVPGMGFFCGGGVKLNQKVIVAESMSFQESHGGWQGSLLCDLRPLSLCQRAENCESQPMPVKHLVWHQIYFSWFYHATMTSVMLSHCHILERIHREMTIPCNILNLKCMKIQWPTTPKALTHLGAGYYLVVNLWCLVEVMSTHHVSTPVRQNNLEY